VLHNSTNKTLTVTPSHSLGTLFSRPSAVVLPPGGARAITFTFNGFGALSPRTVSGAFVFVGRDGPTVVAATTSRAVVVIKPSGALPNTLRASVYPVVRGGQIGEPVFFRVSLTNTGTQTAIGCHVRGQTWAPLETMWQRFNPANGAPIGAVNAPASIPAHQTQTFHVGVRAQQSRIANPLFIGNNQPIFDCANTERAPNYPLNSFDFTARGRFNPVDVNAAVSPMPAGGILNVPATGAATFQVRATNTGPAGAMLIAMPLYRAWVGDAQNQNFQATICRLKANGTCLAAPAASVTYAAARNVVNRFRVFVTAPSVNPGQNILWRRMFVVFDQKQPPGSIFPSVPVAATSVAVKKN
jgi:hypothetical protein